MTDEEWEFAVGRMFVSTLKFTLRPPEHDSAPARFFLTRVFDEQNFSFRNKTEKQDREKTATSDAREMPWSCSLSYPNKAGQTMLMTFSQNG